MNGRKSSSKRTIITSTSERAGAATRHPRILVVGGDVDLRTSVVSGLRERTYPCTHVHRLDEARTAMVQGRYELVLFHHELPDGDGMDLARDVQARFPGAQTVLFCETPTFTLAQRALRFGVSDVIQVPTEIESIVSSVVDVLERGNDARRREERLRRVTGLCRELHASRDEISEQVEVLCNDLASAYQDLSEQINDVAMATEFRTLLRMELDMEELLRTSLEYLLSKTGPTNAAVFLPDPEFQYSLGAYVNYDCPRASITALLDHLGSAICPQMSGEHDLVAFEDAEDFADWVGLDDSFLGDCQVTAFSCHHEGECLAVVILFRRKDQPYEPELAGTLDILRTIFAEQLAQVVRVHHRASPEWPSDNGDSFYDDDDDIGFEYGTAA